MRLCPRPTRRTVTARFATGIMVVSLACAACSLEDIPPLPDHMQSLQLDTLGGEVWVYHSEGHREHAEYLQELAIGAKLYYQRPEITNIEMNIGLVVLGAEDWAEVSQMPYGIAHITNDPPAAILAATHDDFLTSENLARKSRMSETFLSRFEELGLTYEEATAQLTDLLGFHEMGHLYAHQYGVDTWPQEKWLAEFVATYFAYSFMRAERPQLAAAWDLMMDALVEAGSVRHSSLAEFEELYIGTGPDYAWYQGRFGQRVAEVHEQMGVSFVHALKEALGENPERVADDPFRLKQLEEICAGFVAWAPDDDLGGGDARQ